MIIFVRRVLLFSELSLMLTNKMARESVIFAPLRKVDRPCLRMLGFLCLSGLMPCSLANILLTVSLPQPSLTILLRMKFSPTVVSLTSLTFMSGGATVLLRYLMNFVPKLDLSDSGRFLLAMRSIELAGVSVIFMGNILFRMILFSMKIPLVIWVFPDLSPLQMNLSPHLIPFVLLMTTPIFAL